jgi:hypothetical protein
MTVCSWALDFQRLWHGARGAEGRLAEIYYVCAGWARVWNAPYHHRFLAPPPHCTHGTGPMSRRKHIRSRTPDPAPLGLLKAIPDRHLPSLLAYRARMGSHSSDAGSHGNKGTARPPFTPAPPIHTCHAPPAFYPRRPFPPPPQTESSVRAPTSTSTMIRMGFTTPGSQNAFSRTPVWHYRRPLPTLSYSIGLYWIHI